MRIFAILLFSLLPNVVFAACTQSGATVVYVNGIFTTSSEASIDLAKLQSKYIEKTGDYKTKFTNGYNPSHVEGVGDLLKSIMQAYQREGSATNDTDLTTILLQIHPQVTTQKIVLVGHSQGTYYTNSLYEYVTKHGVSKSSVAVYNIATPASFVAGGGMYLTSATDKVINKVREAIKHAPSIESFGAGAALATVPQTTPKDPLPANTSFILNAAQESDENGGHSFSDVYLENAPATITATINNNISGLAASADFNGDCFDPPSKSVSYIAGVVTLGAFDLVASVAKPTLAFARDFVVDVGTKVPSNFAAAAGSFFDAITPTPRTTNLPGSHDVVGALYGSSVTGENLREFGLLEEQGGAVALVVANNGEVKGVETEKPAESLVPQTLGVPPLYPVGGGGSPGFGGEAPPAPALAAAAEPTAEEASTSTASTTPPEPTVPDGTPPSIATVTINGTVLPQTSPFSTTPVATTTTVWSTVVTFDEDISTPPSVKDGTESFDFTNDTDQAVNDCGDGNAKTFCFTYIPPPGIEAAVYWFFRVAGAQDVSGETLASTTYRFIVDTAGPALTLDTAAVNQTLPTVSGSSSFTSAAIELLLNDILYTFSSPNGAWSFIVQPGDELAEGSYPVVATSTDQYNNQVVHNWTLAVDTTSPVLSIDSGPSEGGTVASTSPISFGFSATDATALAYACALDAGAQFVCASPYDLSLTPGAHSFAVTATDAAGNITSVARNFVVLP